MESLVRPHVVGADLEESYRQLALDEAADAESDAWVENPVGDVAAELE